MNHGNFTGLAENYSSYRPKYSESVMKSIIALLSKPIDQCDLADVGAGTGIWTRMLAEMSPSSIIAIEPNDDMQRVGINDSTKTKIKWQNGRGESTGLQDKSLDMVSMASSFHWVDFEAGCKEFHRILRANGRFVALWNPRLIEANSLLQELEEYIYVLNPNVKRVSSGRSGLVETLTDKLYQSKLFTDVVYLEAKNISYISCEEYVGAWRSVNDVQFQLGPEKFEKFIEFIQQKFPKNSTVEITYLTRAWAALKI